MQGFLQNKVRCLVDEDKFITHHYSIYIEKFMKQPIRAYEVDFESKRMHILSTLGEYFEREILINNNKSKRNNIEVVSLIDGSKKNIDIGKVIFKNEFVDSCGMASHKKSKNLIWTAYKEFFERQSFITSYLYKLTGIEVAINGLIYENKIHQYIQNYVDEIKYYNISLSKNLYVILAVGYGNEYKAVGLGTSRNIRKAICKSQKEIMQYFSSSYSKYQAKNIDIKEDFGLKKDAYHVYFDSLSSNELKKSFYYLTQGEKKEALNFIDDSTVNSKVIIKNNYKLLKMEPFLAVFHSDHVSGVKIVKIIDFNWFPNMAPKTYSNEVEKFVEKIVSCERKDFSELLPFP